MSRNTEHKPTSVPFPAKQVGEIESRWDWVELCVWTDCMLTANAYFAEQGLFSLKHAYASASQSSSR